MNITVLVKPVPFKSIVDSEGNVVRNKIKNIINKDDKHAIEEALRIKEKTNGKITSISMTVKKNLGVLKEVLSFGVDEAILLNDNIFAGSDTNSTSYILSQAIKKLGQSDLIICGKSSSDSSTSQVGIGVAAKLGIPFIYNVCEIISLTEKTIRCKVVKDNSYDIVESTLPCLIVVNDRINIPRIPTVSNRLLAEKKEIIVWDYLDIEADKTKCGYSGSVTNVVSTIPLNTSKCPIFLEGFIEDKVQELVKIVGNVDSKEKKIRDFDITFKNSSLEYWVYDSGDNLTLELIAKCHELANKTNASIVVVSFSSKKNMEYIKYGANKIINIDMEDNNYLCKIFALEKLLSERKPEIFLFGKNYEGKIFSAYLAAKLNFGLSADCTDLELDEENKLIQIRSAYGGTMLAKIKAKNSTTQMATVLPGSNNLIYNDDNIGTIETVKIEEKNNDVIILESRGNNNNNNYLDKEIVISCGVGAINQIDNLKELAKLLNASLGITRDVLDKGYFDSNYLIGQSGTITKTRLFLSFGVSGAVEHTVGINSDIVVSINNDIKANIFNISDYCIVEDVNEFLPLFINELRRRKNE